MIETIEVTINNKIHTYNKDTTLLEISKDFQHEFKYPIILARVGNRLKELSNQIQESCTIEFLDLTSREGNAAHINGLVYVMLYAVKRLYGKKANIVVEHSLDKGIYIESSFKLNGEKVDEIRQSFDLFDTNVIGKIDSKELRAAMQSFRFDSKNPTIYQLIADLDIPDEERNGGISFDVFFDAINNKLDDKESKEGIRRIFDFLLMIQMLILLL